MFQVTLDVTWKTKAALSPSILQITLKKNKMEAGQLGDNHRSMHAGSQAAAFMLEVTSFENQKELLTLIFEDRGEKSVNCPRLYCNNIGKSICS